MGAPPRTSRGLGSERTRVRFPAAMFLLCPAIALLTLLGSHSLLLEVLPEVPSVVLLGEEPPDESRLPATAYLGQELPGTTPVVFAPEIVSTKRDEHSAAAFSPDGTELFFTDVSLEPHPVILVSRLRGGKWTAPRIADFSGRFWDAGVSYAPDGSRLYLSSRRPLKPGSLPRRDCEIWCLEREEQGWGEPRYLDGPWNTKGDDGGLTFTDEGTAYLSSYPEGSAGNCFLFEMRATADGFTAPVKLGDEINFAVDHFTPCVARDGSFLLFAAAEAERDGIDLYVSFRRTDKSWTPARALGEEFNAPLITWCPGLSPDGKFLFYSALHEEQLDIYWVDVRAVTTLREPE